MHCLLPPPRSDTGWAEAPFFKKLRINSGRPNIRADQEAEKCGAATILNYDYQWRKPDHITFYEADWKNALEIPRFYSKDHSKPHSLWNSWTKCDVTHHSGGHNWWQTTRFDVWFSLPDEPFEWHGFLITGGWNATFRVRRTRTASLRYFSRHKTEYARAIGRLADAPDVWQIEVKRGFTRWKTVFCAKWSGEWLAAPTLADLATLRLHGLQKAA